MFTKLWAGIKTVMVMVLAGAIVVASLYAAYILMFLTVLAVVGGSAYLYFNWENIVLWFESDD